MHIHVQAILASEHDHHSWLTCHYGCVKDLWWILWGQIIIQWFLLNCCWLLS